MANTKLHRPERTADIAKLIHLKNTLDGIKKEQAAIWKRLDAEVPDAKEGDSVTLHGDNPGESVKYHATTRAGWDAGLLAEHFGDDADAFRKTPKTTWTRKV